MNALVVDASIVIKWVVPVSLSAAAAVERVRAHRRFDEGGGMDAEFWRTKWTRNEIGFHQPEANPLLVRHFDRLALAPGARVLAPLCGKSLDIHWLLARGCRVVGVELAALAVEQLFAELGATPQAAPAGRLTRWAAPGLDVYVGDVFDATRAELGAVDAVYDRAALVALPSEMRARYAEHLMEITDAAPQLLVTFEYDQSRMSGPPFSVTADEVRRRYEGRYEIGLLESVDVPGGLRGSCPATEHAWLLRTARS